MQRNRSPLEVFVITIFFIGLLVLIVLVVLGYIFNWDWAGLNPNAPTFHGRTLWDWLQLLIIPLVLAVAALLFNRATTRTEQNIALDKQREDLLQIYLDRMSDLLLREELLLPGVKPEIRNIARVRTITVLHQLDARRIGYVFSFLRESGLMSIKSKESIISLKQADLRNINFSQADLGKADLRQANLKEANLSGANLYVADLSQANLSGANLRGALLFDTNFRGADLSWALFRSDLLLSSDFRNADLRGAKIKIKQLETQAKSLEGAFMPDGSKHS